MTEEAKGSSEAPDDASAPVENTGQAVDKTAAEAGQNAEGPEKSPPEGADDKSADSASVGTEDDGEDEDKPKKRPRSAALRAKIRELSIENERLRRLEAEREKDAARQPPKEADYNGDFEAFNRDMTAYKAAEFLRKEMAAEKQADIERRAREIEAERIELHKERLEEARKVIPDYDDVIRAGLNIDAPPANLKIMLDSEKSALIAYHLAEKPERAREFAEMSPIEAAKYIGKLEARLSLPKPKTATEAPPPVDPLKGAATPSSPDKELDEWLKRTYG